MRRPGYSLVELLVVLGIVAVLVGMLLPAVQRARSGGSKAECLNHLHQLGLAAGHCRDVNGGLPPVFFFWPGHSPPSPFAGVYWHLLPYLDQQAIYKGDYQEDVGAPVLRFLQCPGDPTSTTSKPLTSYLVNIQMFSGMSAPPIPPDGASNTILFTETYANCDGGHPVYWSNSSTSTLLAYSPDPASNLTFKDSPGTTAGALDDPARCTYEIGHNAQSAHRGAIHVGFADGSARPVTKAGADQMTATPAGTAVTNWAAGFTPNGGEKFGGEW